MSENQNQTPASAVARDVSRTYQKRFDTGPLHCARLIWMCMPVNLLSVFAGPSGPGKSTLLNIIGGLDDFDGGSVQVDGVELGGFKSYRTVSVAPREDRFRVSGL